MNAVQDKPETLPAWTLEHLGAGGLAVLEQADAAAVTEQRKALAGERVALLAERDARLSELRNDEQVAALTLEKAADALQTGETAHRDAQVALDSFDRATRGEREQHVRATEILRREAEQKLGGLPGWFGRLLSGKKLAEEIAAELQQAIGQHAAAIAAVDGRVKAERPSLADAVKAAERPLVALRKQHAIAEATWRAAYGVLDAARHDYNVRIGRIETQLHDARPAGLQRQLIETIANEDRRLCHTPIRIDDVPVTPERGNFSGQRLYRRCTNHIATESRLAGLRQLRREVETQWPFAGLSDAEWRARFGQRMSAMPDETTMNVVGDLWK
jgi:hypothetical protein